MSASLGLWAAGQVVETILGQSNAASNLAVDPSDFLYVTAAFPLLLAISSTKETESVRAAFVLNIAQITLAFVLVYYRLYAMSMSPAAASTVMMRIYGADCILLAISAILRLVTWSTYEERRRMRLLCEVVWIYLPIELGLDFATSRWNLKAGTLLDLLWSVPFLFAGVRTLQLPTDEPAENRRKKLRRRTLLVESLCPMLITTGIFVLAASILSQHAVLSLVAMFLLLVIQGLHSGLVQLNYLTGQNRLLDREQELEAVNADLQRLSQMDALTGISNRRQFTAALEGAWKRAVRRRESIAVLMIDVDFFKAVNDLHGHVYGDEYLVRIARILGQQVGRAYDLLARYGGEEFVLLLPETDMAGASVVAERMLQAVRIAGMVNEGSPFDQRVTVSVGIGASTPARGSNAMSIVEVADKALYEAKNSGRNRICARSL